LFKILSIVKLLDTRPEGVTLSSSGLECKVTGIENLGADTSILLNLNEMNEGLNLNGKVPFFSALILIVFFNILSLSWIY
jgi:hypothetical protein